MKGIKKGNEERLSFEWQCGNYAGKPRKSGLSNFSPRKYGKPRKSGKPESHDFPGEKHKAVC